MRSIKQLRGKLKKLFMTDGRCIYVRALEKNVKAGSDINQKHLWQSYSDFVQKNDPIVDYYQKYMISQKSHKDRK